MPRKSALKSQPYVVEPRRLRAKEAEKEINSVPVVATAICGAGRRGGGGKWQVARRWRSACPSFPPPARTADRYKVGDMTEKSEGIMCAVTARST